MFQITRRERLSILVGRTDQLGPEEKDQACLSCACMRRAGVLSLFESWEAMRPQDLGVLATAAVFLASAYFLLVTGTRRGDLSLITPFRYTALLFAVIAGFVVWGETPNPLAWCGILLVVASGIALLRASRPGRATGPPLD